MRDNRAYRSEHDKTHNTVYGCGKSGVHRQTMTGEAIPPIAELPNSQLSHWLVCFVLEVRKRNGALYPPNTLHHLCAGLLRHLRESG